MMFVKRPINSVDLPLYSTLYQEKLAYNFEKLLGNKYSKDRLTKKSFKTSWPIRSQEKIYQL